MKFALSVLCCLNNVSAQSLPDEFIRIGFVAESDSTSPLEAIITGSLSFEFQRKDLDLFTLVTGGRDSLITSARESNCSYLLISHSIIGNTEVDISLSCIRLSDEADIYGSEFKLPVDLALDSEIQKEVQTLIAIILQDIEDRPELVTPLSKPPDIKSVVSGLPGDQDLSVPSSDVKAPIQISGGGALFIPVGKTSDYFNMGIMPFVQGHRIIRLPPGLLEIGLFLNLNIINAAGAENRSQNLFFSAGPDIRYVFELSRIFSVHLRFNGGGSLLMLNLNDTGYQGLMVPYLSAGAGFLISINERIGVLIDTGPFFYFEDSLTITGIPPQIGVSFNL